MENDYIELSMLTISWTDPDTKAERTTLAGPLTVPVLKKTGLLLKEDFLALLNEGSDETQQERLMELYNDAALFTDGISYHGIQTQNHTQNADTDPSALFFCNQK